MLVKSNVAGTWSDTPKEVQDAVWSAPRGAYQTALIRGSEAWSGAGLRGRARDYAGRYAESRAGLVTRIRVALAPLGWAARLDLVKSDRERRALVLTAPDSREFVW